MDSLSNPRQLEQFWTARAILDSLSNAEQVGFLHHQRVIGLGWQNLGSKPVAASRHNRIKFNKHKFQSAARIAANRGCDGQAAHEATGDECSMPY